MRLLIFVAIMSVHAFAQFGPVQEAPRIRIEKEAECQYLIDTSKVAGCIAVIAQGNSIEYQKTEVQFPPKPEVVAIVDLVEAAKDSAAAASEAGLRREMIVQAKVMNKELVGIKMALWTHAGFFVAMTVISLIMMANN